MKTRSLTWILCSALFPDENQKAIRELPRDAETIALYNKLAGPGPLPAR